MTGASFPPSSPVLRLVHRSPRPRRLEVRSHVLDGRSPYGRSRAFKLTGDNIDELVEIAELLEARR